MRNFHRLTAVVLASLAVQAVAAEHVYGTQTYYSISKDPITDLNKSYVALYEVNDIAGDTALIVRCSNGERAQLWLYLKSKHELVNFYSTGSDGLPDVIMRLGSDTPINVSPTNLIQIADANSEPDAYSLGIGGGYVQQIINGLNAGKRLVMRINRETGGQPLTYTFSANGFNTAWNAIRACGQGVASVNVPVPFPATTTPAGGSAPKFTQWYFTTCRDVTSGTVRSGLVAGRAHLCNLVIDTIPNGATPVSAEFRYELDYVERGMKGKLTLDTVDTWPPLGNGPVTQFMRNGSQLIFTLPLNVRARADRTYTSINVTALIRFSNGSSKRVYEPLPVRPY